MLPPQNCEVSRSTSFCFSFYNSFPCFSKSNLRIGKKWGRLFLLFSFLLFSWWSFWMFRAGSSLSCELTHHGQLCSLSGASSSNLRVLTLVMGQYLYAQLGSVSEMRRWSRILTTLRASVQVLLPSNQVDHKLTGWDLVVLGVWSVLDSVVRGGVSLAKAWFEVLAWIMLTGGPVGGWRLWCWLWLSAR